MDEQTGTGDPTDGPTDDFTRHPTAVDTGDDAVDAALRRLQQLDERPVHEHPDMVEAVHHALQERLAADEDSRDDDEEG